MLSLNDIRRALGRELLQERPGSDRAFSGVTNDSRVARPGEVFFALATDSRDGHDFVPQAVAAGARGVVVRKDVVVPEGVSVFRVRNTQRALGELAAAWRTRFDVKCVLITGNVGKTTTKELTAAVLGRRYNVLKSPANFNDEIGLAMTIFQLDHRHERLVVEAGMFGPGEIRRLCEIARPEIGVVLNVGPTHLERLGSIEAIAMAKAEAVECLPRNGRAVLNCDDPHVVRMAARTVAPVLTFGLGAEADVAASDVRGRGLGGVDFLLRCGRVSLPAHSPVPGKDLIYDALAAIAVGISDGLSVEESAVTLAQAKVPTRLRVLPSRGGATILDDAYNASPASMLAALDVLAETLGRHLALLGDMLELGEEEARGHQLVGERAAAVVDALYTVGPRGEMIAAAARAAGAEHVVHFRSKEEAARALAAVLAPGDVLLVKASHGLALDTVVAELTA